MKTDRVLGEKEWRLVVGNLQLWAKIDLEGKRRRNCQEPGLLGTARERASQEHLARKSRASLLRSSVGCARRCIFPCSSPKEDKSSDSPTR